MHIVSYKKIKYIDGYKINLKNFEENKITNKKLVNKIKNPQNLWFVNIGGYSPFSMQEKHEFGLVVASSELEAKNTAKSKWLIGCKKKHKDDIASLKILTTCYDLKPIKKIGNWEIELIKVNKLVSETTLQIGMDIKN